MEAKTKKKLLIFGGSLALVGLAFLFFSPRQKSVTFTTKVIARDTVRATVTATGSVAPVDEVTVGTQVSGEVKKIYVDFNSHVKKGQLLAELDKSTLQERLNQTNAQLQSAISTLTLARQNYARTKELYDKKAATKMELESVQNSLNQANTSVSQAQINVKEAKLNLSYAEIYSPIDGVVLGKEVEEGQTVASSFSTPTLFTIARDLKNMQVKANIDEADIGAVKVGQKVSFSVDSYSDEFSGEISQIRLSPVTTNNVVTYTVIVTAPNPDEKLYPGMTANIVIVTDEQVNLVVPVSATNYSPTEEVLNALPKPEGKNGEHKGEHAVDGKTDATAMAKPAGKNVKTKEVWIKKGAEIHPRRVQVGLGDGINYIVNAGLAEGDSVVTNAVVGVKEKKQNGKNFFGPSRPKSGAKNSSRQGPPAH